jgi:hypothetical protein
MSNTGALHLPSQRTDYTYYTEAAARFWISSVNISNCPERERNVVLLLDEYT